MKGWSRIGAERRRPERDAFARELRDRRQRGRPAAAHFATAAVINVVVAGLGARWAHYPANLERRADVQRNLIVAIEALRKE